MFEHYLAALLSLGQDRHLAHSALPNAPVQPHREDRKAKRDRRLRESASPVDTV